MLLRNCGHRCLGAPEKIIAEFYWMAFRYQERTQIRFTSANIWGAATAYKPFSLISKNCDSLFAVKLAINRKYKPQVGTEGKLWDCKSQRSTPGSATRLDLGEEVGMSGAGRC